MGAREGAFLDAEELGFDQLMGEGSAVDGHEGRGGAAAHVVERASEAFLADTGLAEQQHGDVGGGGFVYQRIGVAEAGRRADEILGLLRALKGGAQGVHLTAQLEHVGENGVSFVVRRLLSSVGPLLDRFADDAALVLARGGAGDLLEQDEAPHEGRGETRGVADLHPAHRVLGVAVFAHVGFGFVRVVPEEFAEEGAGLDVHVEGDGRDIDAALEHVQLGADHEGVLDALAGAHLAGELGVAGAGGVAHAGEDAAGLVDAEGVDELLAQRRHGRCVHEDHAVLVKPDHALVGAKAHKAAQVAILRIPDGAQASLLRRVHWP